MITLVLFLVGILLYVTKHPWFGTLCWLFALAALVLGVL